MLTVRASLRSHVGLERATNQDTIGIAHFMTIGSSAYLTVDLEVEESTILAVADGMGGHLGGETASRLAITTLLEAQDSISDVDSLRDQLTNLNTTVFRESLLSPERSAMGTTINGLWVSPKELCAFNVGDSATYELVDGYLIKRSVDDVRREDGAGSGTLTQCLGGTRTPVSIEPHLYAAQTTESRWLLCSDGLSSYVSRTTMQSIVDDLSVPPSTITRSLLDAALNAGAPDNVSIIIADIGEKL